MRVLHSAALEAEMFYDDERAVSGAPSFADSEYLSDSINEVMKSQNVEPYVWEVPQALLAQVRVLIPACLAVHDENELQVRTMHGVADFEAAQVELLDLLKAYEA